MIRALHVYWEFQPQSSGVARHMDGLAQALAAYWDVETTVFSQTPALRPEGRAYEVVTGGLAALARAVRAADVVHAHGSRTMISAAALRLARMMGKPAVFTPHCYYQGGSSLRRLGKRLWDIVIERGSCGRAGAVILLHPGWVETVRELGFRPRRVAVIPNCVDAGQIQARFQAARPERLSGHPAVLSVGRVDPVKRLDDAIRTLTCPGMERGELHIVGRGDDTARLQALAGELGLGGRVHFHGWCDDAQTTAMMLGADAMLLASEREGLPTVALEALMARVPIALSAIEGNLAIADAVGWDRRFPLGDHAAMAQCLLACCAQPVPEDVADAVLRQFSWESRSGDVATLYRDLLSGRGRS